MFDRYQICLGYYHYFLHYHKGQGSREYSRLSMMQRYFKPSRSEQFSKCLDLEENDIARQVYNNLVQKHQFKK